MGQYYAYPKPSPPQYGCFWYYMIQKKIPYDILLYWNNPRQYDCDCRKIGFCPAGPPPHPPIMEFVISSNPQHADEIPDDGPQPVENDDWDDGFDYDLKANQEFGKNNRKRSAAYQSYLDAAADAFYKLPLEKQEDLIKKYSNPAGFSVSEDDNHVGPRSTSLNTNTNTNGSYVERSANTTGWTDNEINQQLALSTFLGDPSSTPNLFKPVSLLGGEYIIVCTAQAFRTLEKRQLVVTNITLSSPINGDNNSITGHEQDYLALDRVLSKPWGLGHRRLPPWMVGRPPGKDVEVNRICETVWNNAIDNVKQTNITKRFIGSIDQVINSLEAVSWASEHSNITHQPDTLKQLAPLLGNLDWQDDTARAVLGDAYPETIVGLSYLTVSMYAAPGLLTL